MNKNIKKLQYEFERIKRKGYIKGICNNFSAIGRTFENELNLPENFFRFQIIMELKLRQEEHIVKVI